MFLPRLALCGLAALLTCRCAAPPPAPAHASAPTSPLVDAAHGFAIAMPADMMPRHDPRAGYLDPGAWKAFAEPPVHGQPAHGTPVLALVLEGSNAITTAELHIGIGTDAYALAHCLDVPASGVPPATDAVVLDGVRFTHFHAADAAMSHYLQVEGYRAVHAGRCYAIDLRLAGTRPEVYDPPATPPFTARWAWQRLHHALDGLRLLD